MAAAKRAAARTPRKRVPQVMWWHRLRLARSYAGKTTTEAGAFLNGLSHSTISNWERGKYPPEHGIEEAVQALAAFYEVDFEWIMTGVPSPDAEPESEEPVALVQALNPYKEAAVTNGLTLWYPRAA